MGFSDQVQQFTAKTDVMIDRLIRASALELFKRIVRRTPVDTGRARANWQIALDGPGQDASILFEGEKGKPGKKNDAEKAEDKARRYRNGAAATNQAVNAALESIANINTATKKIVLFNNLTYITGLEYGASKQAPNGNGMVRLSIAEWPSIVTGLAQEK